jgi:hypothetical protein
MPPLGWSRAWAAKYIAAGNELITAIRKPLARPQRPRQPEQK